MIDYDELYDNYLYDCHTANKSLTEEDWLLYGKERHHIEIPDRDGGLLTPTNSQDLTTHQHWVAGVLQSEVLQKCCFAMVPKGALPLFLDSLRAKWCAESLCQVKEKMTPEQRSERARKSNAPHTFGKRSESARLMHAKRAPEERSEISRKRIASTTTEERSEAARKGRAGMTPKERSEIARKGRASMTPEERSECLRKGWETRRRRKAEQDIAI